MPRGNGAKTRTVLLTGFEPFGGETVNASALAVRTFAGRQLAGRRVVVEVLPVRFDEAMPALARVLRVVRPELVICVGEAGGRAAIAVERIAINVDDARIPDNAGHARLTIVECDSAVHRVYPFATPLGPFVGGGDTDFAPVFGEAHARRFEGVVYFTDGRGDLPDVPPALPVLWALTHDDPFLAEWGSVVRLPS